MIRPPPPGEQLSALERYALALLIDLSRLVPFLGDDPAVVRLRIIGGSGAPSSLAKLASGEQWIERGDGPDGEVRVSRTGLAMIAELAGAVTEQRSTKSDRYERVPSSENALVAQGVERDPVVSRAAISLREAVVDVAHGHPGYARHPGDSGHSRQSGYPIRLVAPWPGGHRWAAAFTHDLDAVNVWPAFTLLRLAELAGKGEARRAAQTVRAALSAAGSEPIELAIAALLELERESSIRSTWFVLSGTPSLATIRRGDLTYSPESARARRILRSLAEAGHEVALHGSFETLRRHEAFAEQRSRLEGITGHVVSGVRQHYVRMRPGLTQRGMADAGFHYDSTFGFPDRNGFRLGVADVVPGWSEADQRQIPLFEAPLIWMDRALSKYHGIETPRIWAEDALDLAQRCRAVEGLWVGLWHPNLTPALGFPDAPVALAHVMRSVMRDGPWVAPLADIVRWRRARASVHATAIEPDGSVKAAFRAGAIYPFGVELEDETGKPRESVHAQNI